MRIIQDQPVCFLPSCAQPVPAADAVFASPCGHLDHPSAVWHGLCLMTFQERLQRERSDGHGLAMAAEVLAAMLDIPVTEARAMLSDDEED